MNHSFCEKEQLVLAGLRMGSLRADLLDHIGTCAICSEAVFLAQKLDQTVPHLELPDPAIVWRRAQDAARREALEKATAPIRIARICALIAALVAAPWLVASLSMPSLLPDLGLQFLGTLNRALSGALTPTVLLGAAGSLISLLLGSWYVLREE